MVDVDYRNAYVVTLGNYETNFYINDFNIEEVINNKLPNSGAEDSILEMNVIYGNDPGDDQQIYKSYGIFVGNYLE